ncbi:large tegument protein [Psittacid alphaherpesvirus 5]|nr:large tegument protein [Psittacid alphaherpesvirus 5]
MDSSDTRCTHNASIYVSDRHRSAHDQTHKKRTFASRYGSAEPLGSTELLHLRRRKQRKFSRQRHGNTNTVESAFEKSSHAIASDQFPRSSLYYFDYTKVQSVLINMQQSTQTVIPSEPTDSIYSAIIGILISRIERIIIRILNYVIENGITLNRPADTSCMSVIMDDIGLLPQNHKMISDIIQQTRLSYRLLLNRGYFDAQTLKQYIDTGNTSCIVLAIKTNRITGYLEDTSNAFLQRVARRDDSDDIYRGASYADAIETLMADSKTPKYILSRTNLGLDSISTVRTLYNFYAHRNASASVTSDVLPEDIKRMTTTDEIPIYIRRELQNLFKPTDNFKGLLAFPDTLRILNLTVDDAVKIINNHPDIRLHLVNDARELFDKYQHAFSELKFENIQNLSTLFIQMMRLLNNESSLFFDPISTASLQYLDEMANVGLEATRYNTVDAYDNLLRKFEIVTRILNASVPDFFNKAYLNARTRRKELETRERITSLKSNILKFTDDIEQLRLNITTDPSHIRVAHSTLNDAKSYAASLMLSSVENDALSKEMLKLHHAIDDLSSTLHRVEEESIAQTNRRDKETWLESVGHELETDRDYATFDAAKWKILASMANRYGGRSAVPEQTIKLANNIIDVYTTNGTTLLVAFFRVNPYIPLQTDYSSSDGNRTAALPIEDITWNTRFPQISMYYEAIFGINTQTLCHICQLLQYISETAENTVEGSPISTIDIIKRFRSELLLIPTLKEFVPFYESHYDEHKNVLQYLRTALTEAQTLETQCYLELDEKYASASTERSPEHAKDRLDKGETEPHSLRILTDLHQKIVKVDVKTFTGTAYVSVITQTLGDTIKELEATIKRVKEYEVLVHTNIKTVLQKLWQVREDEVKEYERRLRTLKGLLMGRAPREFTLGLDKAVSLEEIVTLFLNILREVEESSHVNTNTIDWMLSAAKIIDSSELVESIDDRGPLYDVYHRLENLKDIRDKIEDFLSNITTKFENCNVDWNAFSDLQTRYKISNDDYDKWIETTNNLAKSIAIVRAALEHPDAKLVPPEKTTKIIRDLETREKVLDRAKSDQRAFEKSFAALENIYTRIPPAIKQSELKTLESSLQKALIDPIPKWFLDSHTKFHILLKLKLDFYASYVHLNIAYARDTSITHKTPSKSEIESLSKHNYTSTDISSHSLSDEDRFRIRAAAHMYLTGKQVATFTTHKTRLDTIFDTVHIDETNVPLEYSLCYPTVCEKAIALLSKVPDNVISNLIKRDTPEQSELSAVTSIAENTLYLMRLLKWFFTNTNRILSSIDQYIHYINAEEPRPHSDSEDLLVNMSITYTALIYSIIVKKYGSIEDIIFLDSGEIVASQDKLTTHEMKKLSRSVREFSLSITDIILLLMACEPAHFIYFSKLDLPAQTEYITKNIDVILARLIRNRVGVTDLKLKGSNRKSLLYPTTSGESMFDPTIGSFFVLIDDDWEKIPIGTQPKSLLNIWKKWSDAEADLAILQRLSMKGRAFLSMLMTLAILYIPQTILQNLWKYLCPLELEGTKIFDYMYTRAAATDRYVERRLAMTDVLKTNERHDLYDPSDIATSFTLNNEPSESMNALSAFDVTIFSFLFGAQIVLARANYYLDTKSNLGLYTVLFDSRDEHLREGTWGQYVRTNAESLTRLISLDPNPIENICLERQIPELLSLVDRRALKSVTPVMVIVNENKPTTILTPKITPFQPFAISLRKNATLEELPFRHTTTSLFPNLKSHSITDLFFSDIIGGNICLTENPLDLILANRHTDARQSPDLTLSPLPVSSTLSILDNTDDDYASENESILSDVEDIKTQWDDGYDINSTRYVDLDYRDAKGDPIERPAYTQRRSPSNECSHDREITRKIHDLSPSVLLPGNTNTHHEYPETSVLLSTPDADTLALARVLLDANEGKRSSQHDPPFNEVHADDTRLRRLQCEASRLTRFVGTINKSLRKDGNRQASIHSLRSIYDCEGQNISESSTKDTETTSGRSTPYSDTLSVTSIGSTLGERAELPPLSPPARREIYSGLAMACRSVLRGIRYAREYATEASDELANEAYKLKTLLE